MIGIFAETKLQELQDVIRDKGVDSEGDIVTESVEVSMLAARLIDRLILNNPLFFEELRDEIDSMRFYRRN